MKHRTPICDFVRRYAQSDTLRLHMPGHKGRGALGVEALDLTEVAGADSLYDADGIIGESEAIASEIFGCKTLYSTEGSSQCIRAMLYLAMLYAREQKKRLTVLAGRNAHKTFLSAVALLDADVQWLNPQAGTPYLASPLTPAELEQALTSAAEPPTAVYLTSPDYLGNTLDIGALAQVCHRYGALLLVDGAHGAYLKFLPVSRHPIDLGADICCASAHKTLPVLTGGAYLHLSPALSANLLQQAKAALALFGSTSPSYLILQSLDAANAVLQEAFQASLHEFLPQLDDLKSALRAHGYTLVGDEALKITLAPKSYGYTGDALADILRARGIECEFSDRDFLVLMPSPVGGTEALARLQEALLAVVRKDPICECAPTFSPPRRVLSVREAMLALTETVDIAQSVGRVLAMPNVSCPPAVCIAVCGEEIDTDVLNAFRYYGVRSCTVVKNV